MDDKAVAMKMLDTMHREIGYATNPREIRVRKERYAGALAMYAALTGEDTYQVGAAVAAMAFSTESACQRFDHGTFVTGCPAHPDTQYPV